MSADHARAASRSDSGVDERHRRGLRHAVDLGSGYALGLPGSAAEDSPTAFGIGGAGGSFAYGDTATGIGFALTKNRLSLDFDTATQIIQIVQNALAQD